MTQRSEAICPSGTLPQVWSQVLAGVLAVPHTCVNGKPWPRLRRLILKSEKLHVLLSINVQENIRIKSIWVPTEHSSTDPTSVV